ncbi:MAG: glycosyltransferase [Thermoleophilaceae bacterium]|nr:glycosyltransferase [Thermoleophilaceae bacterium]
MKVAILYDCMFPYTVGGGERWYVNVAERLSEEHEVTYVTLKQWDADHTPDVPFRVVTVAPGMELYTEDGRRRIGPPLRYGFGVFKYLLRHGGEYDIVHSSAFPYFSVIGAKAALVFHRRTKLVVDWLEVWSLDYWKGYLGGIGGRVGFAIQQFCARLPDYSFAISKLHADRLPGRDVTVNTGLVGEMVDARRPDKPAPAPDPPRAVFAGRHIPEKNVVALPAAIAHARESLPGLTLTVFGDGPERERLIAEIERAGLADVIDAPGFVDADVVHEALRTASCMVLPSIREGYGLVVIEAVAQGTPSVVVAGPDNAAAEFIDEGVNGFVAASASPQALGDAIVRAVHGGDELRESSFDWYDEHNELLSIDDSIVKIKAAYAELVPNG